MDLAGRMLPSSWESCRRMGSLQACSNRGSAITIVGTDKSVYQGELPWQPRMRPDLETILLHPLTPGRLPVKGQV
jgi:hypothetical protein